MSDEKEVMSRCKVLWEEDKEDEIDIENAETSSYEKFKWKG